MEHPELPLKCHMAVNRTILEAIEPNGELFLANFFWRKNIEK